MVEGALRFSFSPEVAFFVRLYLTIVNLYSSQTDIQFITCNKVKFSGNVVIKYRKENVSPSPGFFPPQICFQL